MALIKCMDCGKEISDKAKTCPNCGCPVVVETENPKEENSVVNENEYKGEENNIKVPPVKSDVKKVAPPVVTPKNEKASVPKIILSIVGIIAALAVVGAIVAFVIIPIGGRIITSMSSSGNSDYSETEVYYEETETENYVTEEQVNNTVAYDPGHSHYYYGKVTKNATCNAEGVETFTCECGASYTEPIRKTSHSWQSATCTTPRKCGICGATDGSALGHHYYSDGECSRCGQMDPMVQSTLSKCKLNLPTVPQTIHYRGYDDEIKSTLRVTGISYQFKYEGDGTVSLVASFSGTKTYDYRGAGQSDSAKIGWKLYDSNGNVLTTGTFYSPSLAEGESFANQEETLLHSFEAVEPGTYRLEILDVN
ncbi:MAG: zinc ribbon domain-containing protein [Clostridia bacterium]|nr:zinc ribbon domain-containing protein [Clostridia bacterium]